MARGEQRGSAPIGALCRIRQVPLAEEPDGVPRQEIAFGVTLVRWKGAALVGGRVDQELAAKRRPRLLARHQSDHRSEIPAGAVATDGNAIWSDFQSVGILADVFRREKAIVHRGGKRMLWRQAIVHREHRTTRA